MLGSVQSVLHILNYIILITVYKVGDYHCTRFIDEKSMAQGD